MRPNMILFASLALVLIAAPCFGQDVSGSEPAAPPADATTAAPTGDATAAPTAEVPAAEAPAELTELDMLYAQIDSLEAQRDTLGETIFDLRLELTEAQAGAADAAFYQARCAELEAELATLSARIAELETERDAAKASQAEAIAKQEALIGERDAAQSELDAAMAERDAAKAERDAALEAAKAAGTVIPGAAGWVLDLTRYSKPVRKNLDGAVSRMGSWVVDGDAARQTDPAQYFSRLEVPLAQGGAATLYRFMARATGKGWVGLGIHFFVEDVKKRRGYGEGKSLLVWFTRDKAARGDEATYLQLYRSDTDVVMERMFDAELADGIEEWRAIDILYDPLAEYIAVAVDGALRIVYKTFFGRDAGGTISLRTLGGGCEFADFAAWTE